MVAPMRAAFAAGQAEAGVAAFPQIEPAEVRAIRAPTLQLSGAKSYPFLGVIDEEIARLLPNGRRIVFPDAGRQMWLQRPEACRAATLGLQGGASG